MLFFFLSGFIAISMVKDFTTYQLIYFIPAVAFFVAHYLLSIKNWFMAEITFLFFFALIILNNLFPVKNYLHVNQFASYDKLIIQKSTNESLTSEKRILVIGESTFEYTNSKLATPYLNWQYAKVHLSNPNYYDNLTAIYQSFSNDMPDVIIDEMGLIPALFEKMPTINDKYRRQNSNVYILKN